MAAVQNNPTTSSVNPVFRRIDYVKITILSLALSALWGSLHSIILPLRLLDFVAPSQKNTYLGVLTLSGLLLAMLVQPVAGAFSDRSNFSWGRRRPYILVGIIAAIMLLPGIGFAGSYIAIFAIYCLMQVSANIAQGPYQAFIPDLVPVRNRGIASGIKGLFEILGGFALVYLIFYLANRYLAVEGSSWLFPVLVILAAMLLIAMLITIIMVKERPVSGSSISPLPTLRQSPALKVRANSGFILFLLSRLLFIMALTTLQSFAFYFLQDMVHVSDTTTATAGLLALVGTGMAVAVYPAGHLSDRLGRKPMLVVSGFVGACGILLLLFAPSYGYTLFSGALIGIAGGIFMSSSWALAIDLLPKNEEAGYLGLANFATAGGAALARLIGPVIDFFNSRSWGSGYQVMLWSCLAYFIIGSLLILKIRKRG